jgi:surface antigen
LKLLQSRIVPTALVGAVAMTGLVVGIAASAPAAEAAPAAPFHYTHGYGIQHGWLCDGWRDGVYRCTAHWKIVNGRYVSFNPSWVPSQSTSASGSRGSHAKPITAKPITAKPITVKPITVKPLPYPSYPRGKPSHVPYPFGVCTYGAYLLAHDNVGGLGMARDWYADAVRRGLPTGTVPRVGATVTFQPFVQGASALGHVGHVVRIGANGAFLMEAMADVAGFGRFGFRWVHTGPGVHFIY